MHVYLPFIEEGMEMCWEKSGNFVLLPTFVRYVL